MAVNNDSGKQRLKKVFHIPLAKGFTKNSDGTISVTGKFTSDQRDEVGDIITRSATENAIPKYKQWGNIRYMHQPRPVGKVQAIGTEDGLEWNEVKIKVVDPGTIRDVEHELLPALSIGAMIRFEDIDFLEDGGWIINAYDLVEISLVDHPANYDATLDLAALPADFRSAVRNEGFAMAVKSYGFDVPGVTDVTKLSTTTEEKDRGESLEPTEELPMAVKKEELQEVPEEELVDAEKSLAEEELPVAEEEPAITEEPVPAEEEFPVEEEPVVEEPVLVEEIDELPEVVEADLETSEAIEEQEENDPDLRDLLSEVLLAIKALTPAEVPAEAPVIEEQTENEAEVVEEEDALMALYSLIENLEAELLSVRAEIAELRKPANRQGAVIPAEVEEPEEEVERVIDESEADTVEEEDSLRSTLRNYFVSTGRLVK